MKLDNLTNWSNHIAVIFNKTFLGPICKCLPFRGSICDDYWLESGVIVFKELLKVSTVQEADDVLAM